MTLMRPEKNPARSSRVLFIGFTVLISRLISSVKPSIHGDCEETCGCWRSLSGRRGHLFLHVDTDLVVFLPSPLLIDSVVVMHQSCRCFSFQMSPGGETQSFAFNPPPPQIAGRD